MHVHSTTVFLKQLPYTGYTRKSTLHRLGISDGMKDKISKAGLDLNTLSGLYNAGGSRALLTILALPPSKTSKKDPRAKPRVTKKLTVLTSLVNFFATG